MLYKFRSKAAGDVIMLHAHGDALMRLLGREPAARGIFEPGHMPALLSALEDAVADAEAGGIPSKSGVSPIMMPISGGVTGTITPFASRNRISTHCGAARAGTALIAAAKTAAAKEAAQRRSLVMESSERLEAFAG